MKADGSMLRNEKISRMKKEKECEARLKEIHLIEVGVAENHSRCRKEKRKVPLWMKIWSVKSGFSLSKVAHAKPWMTCT